MDTIRGLHDTVMLAGKSAKSADSHSITVSTVSIEEHIDSDQTVSVTESTHSHDGSPTQVSSRSSSSLQIHRVIQTSQVVKTRICELDEYDEVFFQSVNLESYLSLIAEERLIHMPRRGSDWDRVLRAAQFFGLQLWSFGERIGEFCPGTNACSVAALGSCQVLVEVQMHSLPPFSSMSSR